MKQPSAYPGPAGRAAPLKTNRGSNARSRGSPGGINALLPGALREFLVGNACIVGVGNRLSGDDATGPMVIDARPSHAGGVWLDVGVAPENYLEHVARLRPDVILVVDAVDFGAGPGSSMLVDPLDLACCTCSTHSGSLDLPLRYWSVRPGAYVQVLAIQPGSIAPGRGLSPPVAAAVKSVAGWLAALRPPIRHGAACLVDAPDRAAGLSKPSANGSFMFPVMKNR